MKLVNVFSLLFYIVGGYFILTPLIGVYLSKSAESDTQISSAQNQMCVGIIIGCVSCLVGYWLQTTKKAKE